MDATGSERTGSAVGRMQGRRARMGVRRSSFRLSRVPRAIISLGMAVLLWLYVGSIAAPEQPSRLYPGIPVQVRNLSDSLVLASDPQPVSLRLRLADSAGTGATSPQPAAFVDLTGVGAGVRWVPVRTEGLDGAEVLSIDPPRVRLALEPAVHRTMNVSVRLEPAQKQADLSSVQIAPAQVTLTGTRASIQRVRQVAAILDPAELAARSGSAVPLQAFDSAGRPVDRVTISPPDVAITFTPAASPTTQPAPPTRTP